MRIVLPITKGDAEDTFLGIPCRVINGHGLQTIPDFGVSNPTKQVYQGMMPGCGPAELAWIRSNMDVHAPFVTPETSLSRLEGKYKGQTCLLVLSGASAAGINERIKPFRGHPDFKVATLNLSAKAVENPDFFFCFEKLCPKNYFDVLDPGVTTCITAPMANKPVAEHWRGKNSYYAYLGDMLDCDNPKWADLPLLYSALTTAVPALQALFVMGFDTVLTVGSDFSVLNPLGYPDNPGKIAQGDFYFDGTKYQTSFAQMTEQDKQCYYGGTPLLMAFGIDGKPVGTNEMLFRHMQSVYTTMEIMADAGRRVHNCSAAGILDFNVAHLEETLAEILPAVEVA